jgi:hypothetical protein
MLIRLIDQETSQRLAEKSYANPPSARPRSVWIIAMSAAREPMFCFWSHGGKPGNSLLYKTAEWESGFAIVEHSTIVNTQHNHDLTFLRAFR